VQYAIVVTEDTWKAAYRLVNHVLRSGADVAWTQDDATVGRVSTGMDVDIPRGSFLVTVPEGMPSPPNGNIQAVTDVRSGYLTPMHAARVAVYGGGGAPFHHLALLRDLGFVADPIMPAQIRDGALANYTAFVMPGGGWHAMQGQLCALGHDGCATVAAFVRAGGLYLGSCAGAYDAALVPPSFHTVCPEQRAMQLINADVWNGADVTWGGLQSPGIGVLEVEVTQPTHPVLANVPRRFHMTHYNGPLFLPTDTVIPDASPAQGLVRVHGLTERFTPSERFLASEAPAGPALAARAAAAGIFNVVAGTLGAGAVLLCGSHPEFGLDLSLDGVGVGALLLANALAWHTHDQSAPTEPVWPSASAPIGTAVAHARARVLQLKQAVGRLTTINATPQWWLDPHYSLSQFGYAPGEIWPLELRRLEMRAREIDACLDRLEARVVVLDESAVSAVVPRIVRDLTYRPAAIEEQDGGYQGVASLLDSAVTLLETASQRLSAPAPARPTQPYEEAATNPYHLAVGSYLAASGLVAGAALLLRSNEALLRDTATMRNEHSMEPAMMGGV